MPPKVYSPEQINDLVERYLGGADHDELDPILDCLRGGLIKSVTLVLHMELIGPAYTRRCATRH